ncbi:MAG TPA: hypothetical protein VGM54_08065 [Chthoniobacter sp.]|jgi:hypothetical protein
MKVSPLFLLLPALLGLAGCTSEDMGASNNPHPRRTYNVETGNYEGPTPMPPPNDSVSVNR